MHAAASVFFVIPFAVSAVAHLLPAFAASITATPLAASRWVLISCSRGAPGVRSALRVFVLCPASQSEVPREEHWLVHEDPAAWRIEGGAGIAQTVLLAVSDGPRNAHVYSEGADGGPRVGGCYKAPRAAWSE